MLMIAVVVVAVLLAIARLGYWPCIAAWSILGAFLVSIIPMMINVSSRPLFVMIVAVGGVCGCWLGSRVYSFNVNFEQQTEFLTMMEYERLYAFHRKLFILAVLCSGLVGGMIGFGICNFVARNPFRR
jgi:integral membrane sensor domain MASE1